MKKSKEYVCHECKRLIVKKEMRFSNIIKRFVCDDCYDDLKNEEIEKEKIRR